MKRRREKEGRTRGREEYWGRGGKEGVGREGRKEEEEEERRRGGTLPHHLQGGGECAWKTPLLHLPPLHWQVSMSAPLSFP